jgi:hypothetical protein
MSNALFVAWRAGGSNGGSWSPVGKLEHIDGLYRFVYTRGAQTLEGFHAFPGMSQLHDVYESEQLFPLFANRLLSRSRPEYEAYLTWSGFNSNEPPEPLAILGVTEGIRQTDQLEVFPCPVPDIDGCYLTRFFLHGLRWMPASALERVSKLQSGDDLALMLDMANRHDPNAVAVRTTGDSDRFLIGYVPRYLAHDIGRLFVACEPDFVQVRVERINPGAPLQMRLLCRMRSCWPEHFEPCAGEEFEPIAKVMEPAKGAESA